MLQPRGPGTLTHTQVVVDASVWASIFMSNDSNHTISLNWWRTYTEAEGIIVAPELLLVEVAAALVRQTKQVVFAQQAVSYLYRASQIRFGTTNTELMLDAADLAARLSLKGGRCRICGNCSSESFASCELGSRTTRQGNSCVG